MELSLCCAVPFYSNNRERRHQSQIIIRNAADIVETLLRDQTRTRKIKPALPDLTCRRRPNTSTTTSIITKPSQAANTERPQTARTEEMSQEVGSQEVERWRNVGSSLRQIADNFGAGLRRTGGQRVSTSDGVISAIITFLLWKLVKKTFV